MDIKLVPTSSTYEEFYKTTCFANGVEPKIPTPTPNKLLLELCNLQKKTKIKMNNDYTHLGLIIDRSGSMHSSWNEVVGGYKGIVKDQKSQPGKCTFSLTVFDQEISFLEDFSDILQVGETLNTFPRGSTALLDAIGQTINHIGKKLKEMNEEDRPAKILIQVQTDGQENASREFTQETIKNLIEEQTEKYNWQFIFLGASLESVNAAKTYGFKASNVSTYDINKYGATTTFVSQKMSQARSVASGCFASSVELTKEEKSAIN